MIFPFIRYKEQQQPCIAQGPIIKSARYWYGDFEGSKIAVSMPRSNETSAYELAPSLGRRYDHRSNAEEWVDLRHMKQLMYDIYDTVEVVLSPQAEARRLKAIEGLEDTSLKTTMETHNFQMNPLKPVKVPVDGQPLQNNKMLKPAPKGLNQQHQHGCG